MGKLLMNLMIKSSMIVVKFGCIGVVILVVFIYTYTYKFGSHRHYNCIVSIGDYFYSADEVRK